MPVLRIRGDADGLPGLELLWLLSLDLVVAATADRDEYLRRVVMDVPVVAATRLEGHVMDGNLRSLLPSGMRSDFPLSTRPFIYALYRSLFNARRKRMSNVSMVYRSMRRLHIKPFMRGIGSANRNGIC